MRLINVIIQRKQFSTDNYFLDDYVSVSGVGMLDHVTSPIMVVFFRASLGSCCTEDVRVLVKVTALGMSIRLRGPFKRPD